MPEGSKLTPSPLDAYLSAEPNEPVFTLQGGDKLAHPAVKLYIRLRRNAAMKLDNDKEREDELRRCTEAEKVLWAMQEYEKGVQYALDEKAKVSIEQTIDLHDYRIHCAQRLSNAFSEINDMIAQLRKMDFEDEETLSSLHNEIIQLRSLFNMVEPRPGMRITHVERW